MGMGTTDEIWIIENFFKLHFLCSPKHSLTKFTILLCYSSLKNVFKCFILKPPSDHFITLVLEVGD